MSAPPESCESRPSARDKIIVLGSGPNRIGQGIEFDYCCVHACFALRAAGFETIMVNCNPETVSTDYDSSDRLYFEPLLAEHVLDIVATESRSGRVCGVVVQFGGQTPLKLAKTLEEEGIRILGTSTAAIECAEDRHQFSRLLHECGLVQPRNATARSASESVRQAERIGYPLVIRPSFVLGGRAMEVVHDQEALESYMALAVSHSHERPVLLDRFLADAIELDVDALCDARGEVYIAGVMQHIEEAGVHSGDSACALPPHGLSEEVVAEIERQATVLARALSVEGVLNVQFAYCDERLYVLEANPRASRTVPFVSKATGVPLVKLAALVMAGSTLSELSVELPKDWKPALVSVKEAVFPFQRFPGVDVMLGPEMRSTGEVMGTGDNFRSAFLKALQGAGVQLDVEGVVFFSVTDRDKDFFFGVGASGVRLWAIGLRRRRGRLIISSSMTLSLWWLGLARFMRWDATLSIALSMVRFNLCLTPRRQGRLWRIRNRCG